MPVLPCVRQLLVMALLGGASPLLAQRSTAPATASRTEFKNLRFDESWVSAQRTPAWDDAIKAIPLWAAPHVSLTLGGQLRWRQEFVRAFNLTAQDDDHGQSRLLLLADLQAGDRQRAYARGFAELRDAQSYGRALPGGTRPTDADRHDWQNLFAEVGLRRAFVRVGRQEVALGRERLVGVPDWANTRRGSSGTRAHGEWRRIAVDLLDIRPLVVRQALANRADSTARLQSLLIGNAVGARALAPGAPATWQLYWHRQRVRTPATDVRRITTGGRTQWQAGTTTARSLELEGAVQSGHVNQRTLDAWFWVVEAQQQWKRVHGMPTVAVGLEAASGERAGTGGTAEAFAVLYPAAHAHGGYADVFGRTNLRELHLIATWLPIRSVDLRLAAYRFDRLRLDDGVWTKQNAVYRAPGSSTRRHVGDEVDVTGSWRTTRHLRVIFGGAVVPPGAFLRETGPARTERWAFVGSTFTF